MITLLSLAAQSLVGVTYRLLQIFNLLRRSNENKWRSVGAARRGGRVQRIPLFVGKIMIVNENMSIAMFTIYIVTDTRIW